MSMPEVLTFVQENWILIAAIILFFIQGQASNPLIERALLVLRMVTHTPETDKPESPHAFLEQLLKLRKKFQKTGNSTGSKKVDEVIEALHNDAD